MEKEFDSRIVGTRELAQILGLSQRHLCRLTEAGKVDGLIEGGVHRRFNLTPETLKETRERIALSKCKPMPWWREEIRHQITDGLSDSEIFELWQPAAAFNERFRLPLSKAVERVRRTPLSGVTLSPELLGHFESVMEPTKVSEVEVNQYVIGAALQCASLAGQKWEAEEVYQFRYQVHDCLGSKEPVSAFSRLCETDTRFSEMYPAETWLQCARKLVSSDDFAPHTHSPQDWAMAVASMALAIVQVTTLDENIKKKAEEVLWQLPPRRYKAITLRMMEMERKALIASYHYLAGLPPEKVRCLGRSPFKPAAHRKYVSTLAAQIWHTLQPPCPAKGKHALPHYYRSGEHLLYGWEPLSAEVRVKRFRKKFSQDEYDRMRKQAHILLGVPSMIDGLGREALSEHSPMEDSNEGVPSTWICKNYGHRKKPVVPPSSYESDEYVSTSYLHEFSYAED